MKQFISLTILMAACALLVTQPTFALEKKLVVVTPFRPNQTDAFKHGFEKMFPGVTVEMLQRKIPAGIEHIRETAGNNTADLFWASAPDAFVVLKGDGLLQKYTPSAQGIPAKIGSYPINDPDGYYTGFAAAGYGIMYNVPHLRARSLTEPREWVDLADRAYQGQVGMSSPSRSGTTHLTVETVLQAKGWDRGWALWKEIAGNVKTISEQSFDVPDGVNGGDLGAEVVIDFYGFSSRASGYPVDFVYPSETALLPASVAVIKNAPHPEAAKAFIEYLLSLEGQRNLLKRNFLKLPVNPSAYVDAPSDFPNPFRQSIGTTARFDANLSRRRYDVINTLFDVMITNQLEALKEATKSIQEAQTALAQKPNAEAAKLLDDARALVAATPISEEKANDPAFAARFKRGTKALAQEQAEMQRKWDAFVGKNYTEATSKAKKALSLIH